MEEYKRNIQLDDYILAIEEEHKNQLESRGHKHFNRSQIIRHLYRRYLEVNTTALKSTGKANSDYKKGIDFKQKDYLWTDGQRKVKCQET